MAKIKQSRFFCTNCGQETIPCWRKEGKEREPGHLKKLYCIHCKEEHNCVEIRENNKNYTLEDFEEEFKNGIFINGERVTK